MFVKSTTTSGRVFFTEGDQALPIPDLIAHQKDSWEDFVKSGLREVFTELNPIEDYTHQKLSLRFKDYYFKEPSETVAEAKYNLTTYDAPLHVIVELENKVTGDKKEQDIFFGDYPWMTDRATFIINGTERVIVSQLIRSAGVFFTADHIGERNYYGAKVIPGRGAWLEFETAQSGAVYVKIDRRRKIPVTTFLRALGVAKNSEIKDLIAKDVRFKDLGDEGMAYVDATLEKDTTRGQSEALIEVYRRLRPGDLATVENAKDMIERTFFDYKRYDYSRVGRFKINQRLGFDTPNDSEHRTLQMQDLIAIIAEIIRLNVTQDPADDIDSLANRRIKLVGELVQRQFRLGMLRLQRNILDRMSMANPEEVTPSQLLNSRPVVAAVKEFFASSQLSQLMDETNPFAELSHKRRLSSMGPGGLTRERAGFDVRDAHPTHYGRICTVETPEGGNVGLVLNLATYARINEYGFIEAPYRVVKNGKVTNEVVYVDASAEDSMIIADASVKLDKSGKFVDTYVSARVHGTPAQVESSRVTHVDAAHKEILGVSASLIPFVEKNRVDRSLMACAMQKQAVPLLHTDAPVVGTGIEGEVAKNLSQVTFAEGDGTVKKADGISVIVKYADKSEKEYKLTHFEKNNDDRCYNSRVKVVRGQKVKKGDVLIEGASVTDGELALGKDLLVAFMPWRGYNMDDAIVISSRLVEDDELTSINIKDYDVEVRETKLGPEQITRDIPNVSEHSLRHLGEDGIVTVGSEVSTGDILVGKITPKGEQELSSEERLLRAIFGEKAKDVRDTSVRMNGGTGKVIGVRIYTREQGHELKAGVLMQIKIYVAEMRKIDVGDKLAGRHGNKGVVSRILPIEDMPFMEDGTPIDILLSPMGVPSRMNLGQLFETHLGMAARALGYKVATPSFNGVPGETISKELKKAGFDEDGRVQLYDGLTGEPFNERTSVGVMHMIKLHHMVEDKIHARSTGPYTMVTQQPLGGKAQNGGQRFGEMEVWALEAYGAATTLQEMLTIKSDDVYGRAKAYEAIIKHEPIEGPKLPEGFNVLVKELQGLGLKVDLLDHGEMSDASDVIEETSREIEKEKDDQQIYAQHKEDTAPEITDLDSGEGEDSLDEEGVQITEGDESMTDSVIESEDDLSEDDGTVDLGEEF
ncbi:DNA-directed RNA polymerase subunit beta [Candidatus Saccharibacteria bacterium]|nr:DNA-directed RNA polymerase subunit beta [Candidatus Saccharibacteria bacterium]MBR6123069.1 DNA-directed RNA polymerase subunit beta [Candidatus Saccharibacteria bacterium]